MIKRPFWLVTGFGLGVMVSVRTRRRLGRAHPEQLTARIRSAVDAALTEGRAEMRSREAALRTVLATPGERNPER